MVPGHHVSLRMILTFIIQVAALSVSGLATNLTSQSAPNITCGTKSTCKTGRSRIAVSMRWLDRSCFCDEMCINYGDCCYDAISFDKELMKTNVRSFECVHIANLGSVYMKPNCMTGWEVGDIADLCSRASPTFDTTHIDPFIDTPVSSLSSRITYKNYFCALCNNESASDLSIWKAQFSCPPGPLLASVEVNDSYVLDHLKFRNTHWGIDFELQDGTQYFHKCFINFQITEAIAYTLRECLSYVDKCDPQWEDKDVEELCHTYTSVMYDLEPYKNYHCAKCNFVDDDNLACIARTFRYNLDNNFIPTSFSYLFDFGEKYSKCSDDEIWDPFFRQCRKIVCNKTGYKFIGGRCIKFQSINDKHLYEINKTNNFTTPPDEDMHIAEQDNSTGSDGNSTGFDANNSSLHLKELKCDKILLYDREFIRGNNRTITVKKYMKTFSGDEYENHKEGIFVCIYETGNFSGLMGWLTLTGLGISCIFFLLHFLAFLMVPDLRNLSGKNLMSLCIALFVAYLCFIVSIFNEYGSLNCRVLSSSMYYTFLASFLWMNVMAYDIWRTLQLATSELRVSSGKQWKKFLVYSIYAWTVPAVALAFVTAVDFIKPEGISPQYIPELGTRRCWFGQPKALLVYFAAPLGFIMCTNIIFFIMAVYIVAKTTNTTASMSSCHPHQTQLKLYLRLALLMGLTWISGIVAGYVQLEPIWYLFILLNTFQGVFIFICFTCSRKVYRVISVLCLQTLSKHSDGSLSKQTSSLSRQALESQDSNQSHLSNSSASQLGLSDSRSPRNSVL